MLNTCYDIVSILFNYIHKQFATILLLFIIITHSSAYGSTESVNLAIIRDPGCFAINQNQSILIEPYTGIFLFDL